MCFFPIHYKHVKICTVEHAEPVRSGICTVKPFINSKLILSVNHIIFLTFFSYIHVCKHTKFENKFYMRKVLVSINNN